MRTMVTGSQGYIGMVMGPMLVDGGHQVVGLDSDLYGRCTFGEDVPDIEFVKRDIRDVTVADLEGFDAVVHLAALSNDPLGDLNPDLTYDINCHATVRVAEAAKAAGVKRFVFSSSCSTYGAASIDDVLTEDAPFNPVTPYGDAKVQAEKGLAALADDTFSPTFLRNATAYGVSPRMRFDLVVNNLVAWAFTSGKVFLKSDGSPWRPLVHVRDISSAVLAVLNAPREKVHNQAFNVGSTEENYQIRTVAEIVRDVVPNSEVGFATDASPDTRCYRVDFSKIHNTLPGFKTEWTVRTGAEEILEAYREIGITLDDFEGQRYKRISHIRMLIDQGKLTNELRWSS